MTIYAIIDPRDNYEIDYRETMAEARQRAKELSTLTIYPYRNVQLRVKAIAAR